MSRDAHAPSPAAHGEDTATPDAQSPAVQDARKVLLITLAGIVVFSAIVHLFVF